MTQYNNDIDMFDAYLNDTMSMDDKREFELRLAKDTALARALQQHKEIVYCLQQVGRDEDQQLEQALKAISDDDFNDIVSQHKHNTINDATATGHTKPRGRMIPINKLYRWMSIAAMVIIIAGVGLQQYLATQSRNKAYDAIYATGFNAESVMGASRADGEMTQARADLNDAIQLLEQSPAEAAQVLEGLMQRNDTDAQDIRHECGIALAYAYVKAHDIDKARQTIDRVKQLNDGLLPEELENLNRALDRF